MDNTKQKATTIFLKAAQYIRQHGWQVSGMSEHGKPRCSMGALQSAGPNKKWDKDLAKLMYHQLQKQLGGINLTEFNHTHRNGEAVAKLFERTATSLGQK